MLPADVIFLEIQSFYFRLLLREKNHFQERCRVSFSCISGEDTASPEREELPRTPLGITLCPCFPACPDFSAYTNAHLSVVALRSLCPKPSLLPIRAFSFSCAFSSFCRVHPFQHERSFSICKSRGYFPWATLALGNFSFFLVLFLPGKVLTSSSIFMPLKFSPGEFKSFQD